MAEPSSLSTEIQLALQQAVGDVNNAAIVIKKQDKRARDERPSTSAQATEEPPVKKKKKSKRSHVNGDDEPAGDALLGQSSRAQPAAEVVALAEGEKRKKKKKDKEKQRAIESGAPSESTSESTASTSILASSADFLSAVVAAASATSNADPAGAPDFAPDAPSFSQYASEFTHYPPTGYPYSSPPPPPSGPHYDQPQDGSMLYPTVPTPLVPDLTVATSEDLLRTLQDLDISKIAQYLRSLGDAAAAANISLDTQPVFAAPTRPGPVPVRQMPAKSDAIMRRPVRPKRITYVPGNVALVDASEPHEENPEHARMLANVWMSTSKLADMAKKDGLVYKKGKFSAIEEAQLNAAIENYRVGRGLSHEDLTEFIFSKEKGRDQFWSEITSVLHLRPIIAVYHHVRRTYHPHKRQGNWVPAEDAELRQAVADYGQQWEKISARVGRMSSDCRDRWRNHLQDSAVRNSGSWSKEEEDELTRIVAEMTIHQGKDIDNDIFWGVVSQRMGNRRGRQQCRIKWTDSLSSRIKNQGEKPRWSQDDAYILVHKIDSLNVHDDSEIDWKKLPDEGWNIWSPHSLQRRWLTMKRSVKGYEEMTHGEIMEILRTKNAHLPESRQRVTSSEFVESDEEEGRFASSVV